MKLCECGCGEPAPIAKWTDRRKGHIKGEPVRFVTGHNHRGKPKSPETRAKMSAYASRRPAAHHEALVRQARSRPVPETTDPHLIHAWLNRHYTKKRICEHCGANGKTDFAFTKHPEPYTRERGDYLELCRKCHTAFDVALGIRPLWTGVANPARKAKAQAA